MKLFAFPRVIPMLLIALMSQLTVSASTVTELTALYQNGQVFLTWKNVSTTNLQYNVYRSLTPFTSSSQLTSSTYLGYVRDNSAQNIRKSQIKGSNYYYVITSNQAALSSDRGLYVITCTSLSSFYYAVTVTTLSDNVEDKTVVTGSNSLLLPAIENVAAPQAVLQTITSQNNGDMSYEYVIWGNNQDVSNWHAFNNLGSYGYNFTVQKRGNYSGQPLCILFQDQNPFKKVDSDFCSDCNILVLDDWLPNGQNTYWIGYNDSYNMYLSNNSNPIVYSGTIKTYSQVRTRYIIRWVKQQPGLDSSRVYASGNSHNGFGAILTAMNAPSEFSSLYLTSPPLIYKPKGGDKRVHELGDINSDLPTDVNYPGTSNPIQIWDFCNITTFYRLNKQIGVPYAQAINGKNDTKAGWVQKHHWYDTVNAYRQGGTWYWDQRKHNGDNAQFTSSETKTNYTRYYTNRSYPAFAYCTANQNPGAGDPTDGDPYGAINGYLDWNDASISDQHCSYSVNCFIKTFYIGGVADSKQYDSCYTDITLRRTQNFHPASGQTISWTNYDALNHLLQSGSFVYDGNLITLYAIKIKKAGCTISLSISNCFGKEENISSQSEDCSLVRTDDGYNFVMNASFNQQVQLEVVDALGHLVKHLDFEIPAGVSSVPLQLQTGFFLVRISSAQFHFSGKMIFEE